jgi:hypothetical protein
MRKLSGYRIEHFLSDNFYASQFFALLSLIKLENDLKDKECKKAERESKKGLKGKR